MNKQRLDFIASSLNEKLKLIKRFDDEIRENCAVDEMEAEILESDEINSRVMDLLRMINEATTPKDSNAGISTGPTTINVSETTSPGTNANVTCDQASLLFLSGRERFLSRPDKNKRDA